MLIYYINKAILAYINAFSIELALMSCLEIKKNENCENLTKVIRQTFPNSRHQHRCNDLLTQLHMTLVVDDKLCQTWTMSHGSNMLMAK